MIRVLEVQKHVQAVQVLRHAYPYGEYSLFDLSKLLRTLPADLPHLKNDSIWSKEKELRKKLIDVGCVLDEACKDCLGNKPETCYGCAYTPFTHASMYPPKDFDGPMCGSAYAFTTCCGFYIEEGTPRVHSDLSEVERRRIVDGVTCPRCRETLTNWEYI